MLSRTSMISSIFAMALLAGCQSASSPGSQTGVAYEHASADDLPRPHAAQLCLKMAAAFEQQGYGREAIGQYQRAVFFDADVSPLVHHRLAVLFARQGDTVQAQREFDEAVRADPRDATLLNDAGYFYLSLGEDGEAEAWFRRAVAADSTYQRAWVNLGLALANERRFDDALATFARVLPIAQAKANVGIALARHGLLSRSHTELTEALSEDPNIPQARAALDWVDLHLGGASPTPHG